MTYEFELRKEVAVDATPEQIWRAIATGPGIDSWFMGCTELEPREGGAVRLTLGTEVMESTVTGWEPGRRFVHQAGSRDEGAFVAFEYLIEGRDGGSTVIRMVQSGLGDDWEAEYDALNEGNGMYLQNLAQYVQYFEGRPSSDVFLFQQTPGGEEKFWAVLFDALGVNTRPEIGTAARLTIHGISPIDGVVDYLTPHILGIRAADGLYRLLFGRGDTVVAAHHIFGVGRAAGAQSVVEHPSSALWQAWLSKAFA